jgi:hypothetical protein
MYFQRRFNDAKFLNVGFFKASTCVHLLLNTFQNVEQFLFFFPIGTLLDSLFVTI